MNVTSTTTRDECIIVMLDEVRRMVLNFSYKFNLEFDDCYQHAALLMLEVWPNIPDGYDVKKYLVATVRRGLYQLLKRKIERTIDAMSLDRPRGEEEATLFDTLEACEYKQSDAEIQRQEQVTEVVQSALQECRIEEQEHACSFFGLNDYVPVAPATPRPNFSRKQDKPRRTDNMLTSIRVVFRKHPQVLGLIQREKVVL